MKNIHCPSCGWQNPIPVFDNFIDGTMKCSDCGAEWYMELRGKGKKE